MKAYSNKSTRSDEAVCLYSEIRRNKRAAKKAKRQEGRKMIELALQED